MRKDTAIRLYSGLFDGLFARAPFLLAPFAWLRRGGAALRFGFWALHNEHLKSRFARCGERVRIHGPCEVTAPHRVEIGDNVHINQNAFIRAEGGLAIGSNTHIARNLVVYTMNHNFEGERLPYDDTALAGPVTIGANVWIGVNVSIAPGVTIGEGAIIGMGSVIATDVPARAIVGTNPLRVLRERDADHYAATVSAGRFGGMAGFPLE